MDYFRKATSTSPLILMDSQNGGILIKGSSICGDIAAHETVREEIKVQLKKNRYQEINIKLDVFNALTMKNMIDLMKSLKKLHSNSLPKINWLYDHANEEMRDMGVDCSELLGLEFSLSPN